MVDRVIVYPSAIPFDTDVLNTNQFEMIAQGYLAEAVFGSVTVFNGLGCLPTSPTADLNVHIQRGMLASMQVIEATSYGSLPADTSDPLMKMGINTAITTFAITPPTTAGYSQNYLIEAQFLESDSGSTVLPYYNAAAPGTPYSGPSNTGTPQNTKRIQRVSLQLKPGTPGAAGSSAALSIPGVDAGWTPLWVVNVNNGQTQITSTSISIAPGAPALLTQLSQLRQKLTSNLTLYVSANGTDTNNGRLANTPFLTPQAAWNSLINNYDMNGYTATISIGAGTFVAPVCSGQPTGAASSPVAIVGAGAGSTTLTGGVSVSNTAFVSVSGVTLSGAYGVIAYPNSFISILSDVTFGAVTNHHMLAVGGIISIGASYSISGAAQSHYNTTEGGVIQVSAALTCTGSGTLNFSLAFAYCLTGNVTISGMTFSGVGSFTGQRYNVSYGGAINTGGSNSGLGTGTAFLPGSTAGTNNWNASISTTSTNSVGFIA